jgi:hypothetical protein
MTHVPRGLNDDFTNDVRVLGKLYADASGLTNVPAGTETDPIFNALSGALSYAKAGENVSQFVNNAGYLTAETDPVFSAWDKGTGITINASQVADFAVQVNNVMDTYTIFGNFFYLDFDNDRVGIGVPFPNQALDVSGNIAVSGTVDGVDIAAFSSSYTSHISDATIHFTSNALWASMANVTNLSNSVSSALAVHIGDTSDPHGADTTQTGIASFAGVRITSDQTVSLAAYVPNAVFATTSSGITVANYTQGTLFLIYT